VKHPDQNRKRSDNNREHSDIFFLLISYKVKFLTNSPPVSLNLVSILSASCWYHRPISLSARCADRWHRRGSSQSSHLAVLVVPHPEGTPGALSSALASKTSLNTWPYKIHIGNIQ
jgi:hypothetical protein